MNGFFDRNGLTMSAGVLAAAPVYGYGFALEVSRCHTRCLNGDHEHLDAYGRSHYATSFCPVVFTLPTAPPWYLVVCLQQEL